MRDVIRWPWSLRPCRHVNMLSNVFTTRYHAYRLATRTFHREVPGWRYAECGGRLCAM